VLPERAPPDIGLAQELIVGCFLDELLDLIDDTDRARGDAIKPEIAAFQLVQHAHHHSLRLISEGFASIFGHSHVLQQSVPPLILSAQSRVL
jgi:hypothetical protein